ncbi:MAG TPA: NADH-quinone oxidoreductase subunit NuoE [Myxococcota bacterium]|nr:NADH-quinone oxidoreductase subunit NuoE [Myxococcota bacterium]
MTRREKWIAEIASEFEPEPQYLIPILQFIQSKEGFLLPDGMQAASRYLRLPLSKVYGVASFYSQFHFEPRGRNTLTVCRGTACHVRGSARLLDELSKHLGIQPGGTTEDLSFTLETVACLGACALAPTAVINDAVHGRQTAASLKKIVDLARRKGKQASQASRKRGAAMKSARKVPGK